MKSKVLKFVLSMFFLSVILMLPSRASASPQVKRIYGINRYETSKSIADEGWTQSRYAIVVSGENFPDALSASVLAKKYNAPILLSAPTKLDCNSSAELRKLKVSEVFIVGGKGAINDNVEASIKNLGIKVHRLCGADRYETSEKVAEQIGISNGVVLTTGLDYADALSVSPIASKQQMPIILVEKDNVSQSVLNLITGKTIPAVYIIGGSDIISDSVANRFSNVKRITGNNKYERNINILNTFNDQLSYDDIYFAYGENFPDALSGSALAGRNNNPIVLVNNYSGSVIKDFLQGKLNNTNKISVLGGNGVIPDNIVNGILGTNSTNNSGNLSIYDVNSALYNFNSSKDNSEKPANSSVDHNGLTVKLDKVEQDDASLRVYVTCTNNCNYKIVTGDLLAKVACNGAEYKYDGYFNFDRFYDDHSEQYDNIIDPKVSERSVIFFKTIKNAAKVNVSLVINSCIYDFNDVTVNANNSMTLDKFYEDIGTEKASIVKSTYDIFAPKACKIAYKDDYKAIALVKTPSNSAEDNALIMLQFFNNGHIGISFTNIINIEDSSYLRELLSNALCLFGSSSDAFLSEIARDSLICLNYSEDHVDQIACDAFGNSSKIYLDKIVECPDGIVEYRLGMNRGKLFITTLAASN